MYYFAYGGNTNPYFISSQYPNIKFISKGKLKGYRLVFRETSLNLTPEDSYCDIEKDPKMITYGVVYEVEEEDMKKFDVQEIIYKRVEVEVVDEFNNKLKCITYIMLEEFNDYKLPTARYYKVVLTGYKHYKLPVMQFLRALELCHK